MTWTIEFLEDAEKDLERLDHSVQAQIFKGLRKISQNPLPIREEGYGKPLGKKQGIDLTDLLKIKFRNLRIRIVYKVEKTDTTMKIIIISAQSDFQVYKEAAKRRKKYHI